MNIINVASSCEQGMGNTGKGKCWNDLGIWRGVIFGPTGVDFSATDIAALKSALEAGILEDVAVNRVRPLQDIIEITPSGGDPITFTEPSTQRARITSDGYQQYIVRYSDGGFCLSNRLRAAKSLDVGFMVIMDNGLLQCYSSPNADSVRFIPGDFYALPALPPTQPSEAPSYRFQLTVAPEDINEASAIIDFKLPGGGGLGYLKGLQGLEDVTLYQQVARALGVLKLGAKLACGSVDLYEIYADELAAAGAWVARNKATNAIIAITSVVKNTVNGGWTITLNTSDANYTATANGIAISLAGPTELDALNVTGYESNVIYQ
jgi:hypothetical protein